MANISTRIVLIIGVACAAAAAPASGQMVGGLEFEGTPEQFAEFNEQCEDAREKLLEKAQQQGRSQDGVKRHSKWRASPTWGEAEVGGHSADEIEEMDCLQVLQLADEAGVSYQSKSEAIREHLSQQLGGVVSELEDWWAQNQDIPLCSFVSGSGCGPQLTPDDPRLNDYSRSRLQEYLSARNLAEALPSVPNDQLEQFATDNGLSTGQAPAGSGESYYDALRSAGMSHQQAVTVATASMHSEVQAASTAAAKQSHAERIARELEKIDPDAAARYRATEVARWQMVNQTVRDAGLDPSAPVEQLTAELQQKLNNGGLNERTTRAPAQDSLDAHFADLAQQSSSRQRSESQSGEATPTFDHLFDSLSRSSTVRRNEQALGSDGIGGSPIERIQRQKQSLDAAQQALSDAIRGSDDFALPSPSSEPRSARSYGGGGIGYSELLNDPIDAAFANVRASQAVPSRGPSVAGDSPVAETPNRESAVERNAIGESVQVASKSLDVASELQGAYREGRSLTDALPTQVRTLDEAATIADEIVSKPSDGMSTFGRTLATKSIEVATDAAVEEAKRAAGSVLASGAQNYADPLAQQVADTSAKTIVDASVDTLEHGGLAGTPKRVETLFPLVDQATEYIRGLGDRIRIEFFDWFGDRPSTPAGSSGGNEGVFRQKILENLRKFEEESAK